MYIKKKCRLEFLPTCTTNLKLFYVSELYCSVICNVVISLLIDFNCSLFIVKFISSYSILALLISCSYQCCKQQASKPSFPVRGGNRLTWLL